MGILSIASNIETPEDPGEPEGIAVDYAEGRLVMPPIALRAVASKLLENPSAS